MPYKEITRAGDIRMSKSQDKYVREFSSGHKQIVIVHDSQYRVRHVRLIHFFAPNLNIVIFPDQTVDVYELKPEDPDDDIVLATGIRYAEGQMSEISGEIRESISRVLKETEDDFFEKFLLEYVENTKPTFVIPEWMLTSKRIKRIEEFKPVGPSAASFKIPPSGG